MKSFNVASQGPFPVMIEDFSSRNSLLPESNVHPLSVTDLLQWEDSFCYKSEDRWRRRDIHGLHNKKHVKFKRSSKRSQLLVVKILSAIQFKCKRATQLPSRTAHSVHTSTSQLSRSSLPPFGLRISLERTAFILLCCIFSVLSEPLYSILILFWAH